MSVHIMIRVLSLGYVSFQQIRTLASPFPPVGLVAAPCGSPAIPHLPRYYEVVRLLGHPSVLPSVDPRLHISFNPFEGVPPGVKEMGSSLGFPASLFGNMPWARDTADFSTPSHSGIPACSGVLSVCLAPTGLAVGLAHLRYTT